MADVKKVSAARGQSIHCGYGRDDSSHKVEGSMGQKMGGSTENLAHSLSGAGAVSETKGLKNQTD